MQWDVQSTHVLSLASTSGPTFGPLFHRKGAARIADILKVSFVAGHKTSGNKAFWYFASYAIGFLTLSCPHDPTWAPIATAVPLHVRGSDSKTHPWANLDAVALGFAPVERSSLFLPGLVHHSPPKRCRIYLSTVLTPS